VNGEKLEQRLGHPVTGDQLTADEVKAFVTALKDTVNDLDHADIADIAAKADLYEQLGIELTYHPGGRLRQVRRVYPSCKTVRGRQEEARRPRPRVA
jgi:hypothetical protein